MIGDQQQVQGEDGVAPGVQEVAAQHRGRVVDGEGEACSSDGSLVWLLGGSAGEGEEDVVEVGGVHGEFVGLESAASSRSRACAARLGCRRWGLAGLAPRRRGVASRQRRAAGS